MRIKQIRIKQNHQTIIFLEKEKVLSDNSRIAKRPNNYFTNVATSLEIPESGNIDQLY